MVPPLFTHTLRYEPQCTEPVITRYCTNPLTGINRQSFTFARAISSCSFRVLFTEWTYELSTRRSLSRCTRDPLLVPTTLLFSLSKYASPVRESQKGQQKSPSSYYSGRRAFTLVLPPAFANISRYRPQQVCILYTYSNPITAATGKF